MNTFLPLPDFAASAASLDRARLGKQRIEVLQLLRALHGLSAGWINHPAARMWRGYEQALAEYGAAVCCEWLARGYRDTTLDKVLAFRNGEPYTLPPWFGDDAFHLSHRSNLVRKDPVRYGAMWPDVPPDLPYVWPRNDR